MDHRMPSRPKMVLKYFALWGRTATGNGRRKTFKCIRGRGEYGSHLLKADLETQYQECSTLHNPKFWTEMQMEHIGPRQSRWLPSAPSTTDRHNLAPFHSPDFGCSYADWLCLSSTSKFARLGWLAAMSPLASPTSSNAANRRFVILI